MQMTLMLRDWKPLILIGLPFKVLIGSTWRCSCIGRRMEIYVGLKRISSYPNFHLALTSQECIFTIFIEASGGWAYLHFVLDVEEEDETNIHVHQNCVYATQIWLFLDPFNFIIDLFTFYCRDQIFNKS